jgi:hypothetical protein
MNIVKDLKTASDIDPDADQQCFLGDAEDPFYSSPNRVIAFLSAA